MNDLDLLRELRGRFVDVVTAAPGQRLWWSGKLTQVDEQVILMQIYEDDGTEDCEVLIPVKTILNVCLGRKETGKIQKVAEWRGTVDLLERCLEESHDR